MRGTVTVVPGLHPLWVDTSAREISGLNHRVTQVLRGWRRVTARRLAGLAMDASGS